jgi:hypothetical protein
MGCHTWFWTPLSEEHIPKLKELALKSLENRWKEDQDEEFRKQIGPEYCLTETDYKFLKDRIECDNLYITADYANAEINDYISIIDGDPYVNLSRGCIEEDKKTLMPIHEYFHDVFRIYNYPNWIIYNIRQLRRRLKKKWYDIPEEDRKRVSEFWKLYPGGVITFG